jgi:hypothetical protein
MTIFICVGAGALLLFVGILYSTLIVGSRADDAMGYD